MAHFQKVISIIFLSLLVSKGSTQNVGINVTNPVNPFQVVEPAGVVLDDDQAVMGIKYTKTNPDNAVGLDINCRPVPAVGIGQKIKAGLIGAEIESEKWGAYITVNSLPSQQGVGVYSNTNGSNSSGTSGYFLASGSNMLSAVGVNGDAISGGGLNIGVLGNAYNADVNWAGYFGYGNVFIENKLGIGQEDPIMTLDVLDQQAVARFLSNNSVNGAVIELRNSTTAPTLLGAFNFGTTSTTPGQIAYLANDNMTFRVNNTERMRINSTGLMGIGRTPTTNRLEVEGAASKSSAGDWLANSDARLKKNIQPLDGEEMLKKLLSLQGVTYEWNDDKTGTTRPEGVQYGFTAQNIQDVFPTLVETDAAGYLQTPYGTYDAMMVEALRYLHEENMMLKQELLAIKEMINASAGTK